MFGTPRKIKQIFLLVSTLAFVFLVLVIYNIHSRMEITKLSELYRQYDTMMNLKTTNCSFFKKEQLLLFVGIHSAPTRTVRRNAIRETWMKECQCNVNAVCMFFTDGQDEKGKKIQGDKNTSLESEVRVYQDIILAEVPGGFNFALKYLWMLQWADKNYKFRYFLRLDDDYFICFRKLMLELEFFRPKEKFQWGWLHCSGKGIVKSFLHSVKILFMSYCLLKE